MLSTGCLLGRRRTGSYSRKPPAGAAAVGLHGPPVADLPSGPGHRPHDVAGLAVLADVRTVRV